MVGSEGGGILERMRMRSSLPIPLSWLLFPSRGREAYSYRMTSPPLASERRIQEIEKIQRVLDSEANSGVVSTVGGFPHRPSTSAPKACTPRSEQSKGGREAHCIPSRGAWSTKAPVNPAAYLQSPPRATHPEHRAPLPRRLAPKAHVLCPHRPFQDPTPP